ncbi:MAG TPA: alpha/beta hydrolase [Chitinophagaceae bacterium]|nr:alpha/beta hydrolase [Chitinophagaceae bacterium]
MLVLSSPAKYPLVLSIHGGGFHKGDKTDNAAYYTSLASSGFVVAAINYRIGWTQDSVNLCDGDSLEAAEAVYRALQDARASLRFMTAHADDYKIDTNWMFISGSSAGALTALYTAYADQKDMDTYFPGISDILGPIDADNALKNTYSLKAVVSMWGALASPYIISAADAKPTIFFQGLGDSVVPCGIGNYYNCPNLGTGYGSIPLYQRLQSLNVPAIAHIDPAGDHGVYTEDYRTPNIVCFLNDVMAGDVKSMYDTKQSSNCN